MEQGTTYRTTPLKSALILIGVLGATIAFAFWFIGYLAPDPGGAAMTGHGETALVLGVTFSIILGVRLMALVFLSIAGDMMRMNLTTRRPPFKPVIQLLSGKPRVDGATFLMRTKAAVMPDGAFTASGRAGSRDGCGAG